MGGADGGGASSPPAEDFVDAVVVGSGFGGSVAAYRLSEQGRHVVVMERGRAYPPGSFARTPSEFGQALWDPSAGLHGLFNAWTMRGLESLVSSGLGGGSLIYANVLLRKDEHWFVNESPLPGGGYESWPLTREDLLAVEAMVNARIRANAEVQTRFMTPDEAITAGALALFGEKYGDEVRVVSMGGPDEGKGEGRTFSTELCGGTHVRRVGDIGFFKIVSEQALAAGVRRIEAVTGKAALEGVEQPEVLLEEAAAALRTPPESLPSRIAALLEERRRLERELSEARRKLAAGGGGTSGAPLAREVAGVQVAARAVVGLPPKDLKPMVDDLKKQLGSGVAAVVAVNEGKASIVVGVTDDLTSRFSAVDLVRVGAAALGGKGGGGRPDMAQAGGPAGDQAEAALQAIEKALTQEAVV